MRNIKEIKPILSALYCLNFGKDKNEDMDKILKYAFARILDGNTNLLTLACIGRTYEEIKTEIYKILEEDTKYRKE